MSPCFSLLFPPTIPSHQKKLRTGLVWITVDIPGRESEMSSSGKRKFLLYASVPAIFKMPLKIQARHRIFKGGVDDELLYELCAQNKNFSFVRFFKMRKKKVKRCSVLQQLILRCRSSKNGRICQTPCGRTVECSLMGGDRA